MTSWQVITADRHTTYAGVALELRDEFTGRIATGPVSLSLDTQDGAIWRPTNVKPTRNAGGIFLYAGLGRRLDPAITPMFKVRIRIDAAYYRPAFQATDDAIEFDVPTYNHAVPPVISPLVPEVVLMWPTVSYPFAAHIRRIHGRVIDIAGNPLADAQIEADGVERVMTDETGAFALPLRWQAPTAVVNVAVIHARSGLTANRVFDLPADLSGNQDITVT